MVGGRLRTCFSLLFHRYLFSSLLSSHWKIHWTAFPLIQQLYSYCQLHFDLQCSSSPMLLGLSILLRKDFLLAGTLRLNHWHSLKIAFIRLGFAHGILSFLIMMYPSCKATMLRNLSHFSPLQVHKPSNVVEWNWMESFVRPIAPKTEVILLHRKNFSN